MTDKYEEVWSGIKSEIKTINCKKEKEIFYEKNYSKIGINTDDLLKFTTLAIIVRCAEGGKLYPQI